MITHDISVSNLNNSECLGIIPLEVLARVQSVRDRPQRGVPTVPRLPRLDQKITPYLKPDTFYHEEYRPIYKNGKIMDRTNKARQCETSRKFWLFSEFKLEFLRKWSFNY